MQKSTKSLFTFILIIAIFALGYFGVYGMWTNLSDAKTNFEITQTENDKLKQAQQDLTTFINDFQKNKELASKADRTLPVGDPDLPYLLDIFAKISQETSMNLVQMNFQQRQKKDPSEQDPPNTIQYIDVNTELTGSYEAFKEFLLRVQGSLRLIDLLDVAVTAAEGEADPRLLNFSINFRTYYQK
jgi:Tfp pilus assembly protein PilO